jgi:hypothetical protein
MRNTEIICQEPETKEWPLLKVGDREAFGPVLSMGIMLNDFYDGLGCVRSYVDCAYARKFERYILPDDDKLKEDLISILWDNIEVRPYHKLWITKLKKGYKIYVK